MADKSPSVLAERLNHLFATVHPRGRGPYSNGEVAQFIRDQGGDISKQYIAYLRNGERDNPRMHHLAALARFFGVKVSYFFDDGTEHQTNAALEELAALRDGGLSQRDLGALEDAGVTRLAMRAVGLSPKGLDFAEVVLDRLRELEGLPPKDCGPEDSGTTDSGDEGTDGGTGGKDT
ncbi:XRE family transcriptional regulator [Streptomyces sp. B1866]|uniref:XRE family transcriptional regulator n=1 Tax=Streptomyces sp. B1866 TaxID=3075431 RepID=UPI00288DB3CA|nr:XRE family transcriptional regulator [Streptomyces sp. B1866]MDT3395918.1 XRE family transcriptional regulator [Streptomyces sp. B1866]